MTAPVPARSITRQTVIQVAIRIAIVVAVATVISYVHVRSGLQAQALEQLGEYVAQRGVRESAIFVLAQDNLRTFAQAYGSRLGGDRGDPRDRFAELFVRHDDGTTRLRESVFQRDGVTGVIGKHVEIDVDLQRRLVMAFELLTRFGPAWQNRFVNLYVTTPESAVLMFWPDEPWGLNANSWEVSARLALSAPGGDDVVLVIDDQERGARESTWSDLYFDYAASDWMLSTTEPVNLDRRYLLSVGHDMLLKELIERTVNNRLEGTYNIIVRKDGRLIAHPRLMDALQARSGDLYIQNAGDPNLLRIFELVTQGFPDSAIIDNPVDEEYLAVAQLQGPGWYLVTVYPKIIIAERAFDIARSILIIGAAVLLLEIMISFYVLRKQVAKPLNSLVEAANRVGVGDFNIQLDERRPDEIGQLAQSFNIMSKELKARETTLNERSAKLSLVNNQLAWELEERKRAEAEIARQREALHQSEKLNALGSLLAGVAHELNNPLSVVVGRAIMMEESATDAKARASATKIREAAERCASIVKTFLAIARQQPPEHAPVQLNRLIEAAVELVSYSLRTADIQVVLKLDDSLPELSADGSQLTQVFTNLVVNAQQALAEIPPPRLLSISSRLDEADGTMRLVFADNGPGVPAEIRRRVFEPFFTSKPVGVGTGIGLSYSYGVVESHGGRIVLDDSKEGGARFIIILPLTQEAKVLKAPEPLKALDTESRSVLIVDDEPEIAAMLGEMLRREGHRIAIAASGNEALRELARSDYDVILSDLKMPDLDGKGLFDRLQRVFPHLTDRVVFITGDTLSLGGSGFKSPNDRPVIEKPFVPYDVIQVVRKVLSQV